MRLDQELKANAAIDEMLTGINCAEGKINKKKKLEHNDYVELDHVQTLRTNLILLRNAVSDPDAQTNKLLLAYLLVRRDLVNMQAEKKQNKFLFGLFQPMGELQKELEFSLEDALYLNQDYLKSRDGELSETYKPWKDIMDSEMQARNPVPQYRFSQQLGDRNNDLTAASRNFYQRKWHNTTGNAFVRKMTLFAGLAKEFEALTGQKFVFADTKKDSQITEIPDSEFDNNDNPQI